MFNPRNAVTLFGNVVRPSRVVERPDNSKTVFITVAVKDNYQTAGEWKSEFIECQKYIGPDANGQPRTDRAESLGVGDQIIVYGHLTCKSYEKDGETVYPPITVAFDNVFVEKRGNASKMMAAAADAE